MEKLLLLKSSSIKIESDFFDEFGWINLRITVGSVAIFGMVLRRVLYPPFCFQIFYVAILLEGEI